MHVQVISFVGLFVMVGCAADTPAKRDSEMAVCLDGPVRDCTPVQDFEEAKRLVERRAAENKRRAESLDVDYEDVVYAALAGSKQSVPYCLALFHQPPSRRLKELLVARGHELLDCDGKPQPSLHVDIVEQVSPNHYRAHITAHCGTNTMCGGANWYYIMRERTDLVLDRRELDWIQ